MLWRKPKIGYQKEPKKKKKQKGYISSLFVSPKNPTSINEKVIKFLIYISLRLVIKPKRWKHPQKNYEIIDRTYKKIASADFIYIPSSIAFYLIMAFMPILSLVFSLYMIPGFESWLRAIIPSSNGRDVLTDIISKFIPGARELIKQVKGFSTAAISSTINIAGVFTMMTSMVVSMWIAAGGFSKLVFTQSYIYKHKFVGGYWANKMKGMGMVIIFTILLSCGLTLNIIVTGSIEELVTSDVWKKILVHLWLIIALGLGLFALMVILFRFSPKYKIKIRHIIPGAMVATIPMLLFLSLFSIISGLWSYSNYGIIGVVMYIGMASLIISYFIFVGLIANSAYYKTFIDEKLKTKWSISKK